MVLSQSGEFRIKWSPHNIPVLFDTLDFSRDNPANTAIAAGRNRTWQSWPICSGRHQRLRHRQSVPTENRLLPTDAVAWLTPWQPKSWLPTAICANLKAVWTGTFASMLLTWDLGIVGTSTTAYNPPPPNMHAYIWAILLSWVPTLLSLEPTLDVTLVTMCQYPLTLSKRSDIDYRLFRSFLYVLCPIYLIITFDKIEIKAYILIETPTHLDLPKCVHHLR